MLVALLFMPSIFAQDAAFIDTKATYTLISQKCEDGKTPIGAGANGGTITVKFNGEKMVLVNSKHPGKDVAVDYRLDGNTLVNVNARTKEEVKTKLEPGEGTLTWTSDLPADKAEAKKICPGGGKTIQTVYKKSR